MIKVNLKLISRNKQRKIYWSYMHLNDIVLHLYCYQYCICRAYKIRSNNTYIHIYIYIYIYSEVYYLHTQRYTLKYASYVYWDVFVSSTNAAEYISFIICHSAVNYSNKKFSIKFSSKSDKGATEYFTLVNLIIEQIIGCAWGESSSKRKEQRGTSKSQKNIRTLYGHILLNNRNVYIDRTTILKSSK